MTGDPEDAIAFQRPSWVRPIVAVFPLEEAALDFEEMMSGKVQFQGF
jgi:hypothetical protein